MTKRQFLVLAIGIFAVSWAGPLIRLADEASFLFVAAARLALASPVMLLLALYRRNQRTIVIPSRQTLLMILSGVALAAHFGFWVASISHTSIMASVALVAMSPLFAALGEWIFLSYRPSKAVFIGILISAVGAAGLAWSDFGAGAIYGDLLAIVGAILASVYLLLGRYTRQRIDLTAYGAIVYAVGASVLAVVLLIVGVNWTNYLLETYVFILFLALIPQLIGHNAINYSLGYAPAAVVALAILGEPVGSALIAALLFEEIPSVIEACFGCVILLGVGIGVRGAEITKS